MKLQTSVMKRFNPEATFNYLIGQVMKETKGVADPKLVRHLIATKLIEEIKNEKRIR